VQPHDDVMVEQLDRRREVQAVVVFLDRGRRGRAGQSDRGGGRGQGERDGATQNVAAAGLLLMLGSPSGEWRVRNDAALSRSRGAAQCPVSRRQATRV
jgi:hypothetical protein